MLRPRFFARTAAVLAFGLGGCKFTPEPFVEPGGDATIDAARLGDGAVVDGAPSIDAAPAATCPADYPAIGGSRYRIVTAVATWGDARGDCADDGATTHLVVVGSEAENLGLALLNAKLWIGLSDRVTTDSWRWVTLEDTLSIPASGPPWKSGQPNDGGGGAEDCVVMEAGGGWDDRQCDNDTNAYVCECDAFPDAPAQYDPQS